MNFVSRPFYVRATVVQPSAAAAQPAPLPPGYPRLVADIGAELAHFALVDSPGAALRHQRVVPTAAYAGVLEAIRAYLSQLADEGAHHQRPVAAALTLSMPSPHVWPVSAGTLQAALALEALLVLDSAETALTGAAAVLDKHRIQ